MNTGTPAASAALMGGVNAVGSASVVMMAAGLAAAAELIS